ncbi:MAG: hypothetical protein R6U21_01600 [Thermoplasmatota archaeon]
MLDEENIPKAIFDYATEKYSHRLEEFFNAFVEEFPEKDWDLPEESWRNNFLSWFFYEKPLPETGITIAEEFAQNSTEITSEMRENIQNMRNIVRSEFVVLSVKNQIVKIKDTVDGKIYTVKQDKGAESLSSNMLIVGRIYPFGKYYRATGIFLIKTSPLILDPSVLMHAYEGDQLKRFDSIQLRKSSTLQSVMKKFPAHWIDWMSDYYNVNQRRKNEKIKDIKKRIISNLSHIFKELSTDAKDVLRLCMKNNGVLKYGKLKKYDDEFGFFWNENPIESPIGELRQKGLLFVGKMRFNERNYKIAFVPIEFRDILKNIFEIR